MPERDEDTGRYTSDYTAAEFIDAIQRLGGAGSTQEIATEVGCIYDTAYKNLRQFEDDGKISSRKVGNARLWSVAD